jgi:hypothetical protein
MGDPVFPTLLPSLGNPQLTVSIAADSAQTTYAAVAEAAVPGGGGGSYVYAWTLQRDDGTDGTARLSDPTVQAPPWTPDRAGWWHVACTVTSGGATVTASRRVKVTVHTQAVDVPLSTLVMVPS